MATTARLVSRGFAAGLSLLLLTAMQSGASAQMVPPGVGSSVKGATQGKDTDLIDGINVETLADELRSYGYQAKTITLSDGSVAIDSASSGIKFRLSRYSCTEAGGACSVDIGATWLTSKEPVAIAKLNDFNAKYRFAKAYNDSDGDLILKMYVTLTGGVTKKNFKASFDRWISILGEFDTFRQK